MTKKVVLIIRQPGRKDRYRVHNAEVLRKDVSQNVILHAV